MSYPCLLLRLAQRGALCCADLHCSKLYLLIQNLTLPPTCHPAANLCRHQLMGLSAQFAMMTIIVPGASLGIVALVMTVEKEGMGGLLVTDCQGGRGGGGGGGCW